MLDNVNGTKVAASQRNRYVVSSIVIGLSTLENSANKNSTPNEGSLTVPSRRQEAWFCQF